MPLDWRCRGYLLVDKNSAGPIGIIFPGSRRDSSTVKILINNAIAMYSRCPDRRHKEPDEPPMRVGHDIQLGVHTALCSAGQMSASPPFRALRLEA